MDPTLCAVALLYSLQLPGTFTAQKEQDRSARQEAIAKLPSSSVRFDAVSTRTAPGAKVDAAPYLARAGIRVGWVDPPGSRLVFVSNEQIYNGKVLRPQSSPNVLMLDTPDVGRSAFALQFDRPVAEVKLTIPALTAGPSGIIFPAVEMIVLSQTTSGPADAVDKVRNQGAGMDCWREKLLRSYSDVASITTARWTTWDDRAISEVIFVSDPQGVAAFRSIVIEKLSFKRKP